MTPSKGNPKIQFRLDRKRHAELLQMAEESDKTVSEICREAVDDVIWEWKRKKGFKSHYGEI